MSRKKKKKLVAKAIAERYKKTYCYLCLQPFIFYW